MTHCTSISMEPGHLDVSVVHSRHCPYGNDATYELDSTQCGGPLLHHMHAECVQFSQVVCALHGAAVHTARSTLVSGIERNASPDSTIPYPTVKSSDILLLRIISVSFIVQFCGNNFNISCKWSTNIKGQVARKNDIGLICVECYAN